MASADLPNFDLHFATDESFPIILDIHNNNSKNLPSLHPIPSQQSKLFGSKKRKRLTRPEKYDGKQFRAAFLQGNETDDQIAAMKAECSKNQINENFYEEQTEFCENYLKEFLKNCSDERAAEIKHKSREAAVSLYDTVEFEDLPLDVPNIASEEIIKRSKELKEEHEKVSDLAEKCVNDLVENMFEENGAGTLNAQTLIVGDPLTKKETNKPEIFPDFSCLTYHGAYRILSYYKLFNPYCFTYPMHYNIPSGFEANGYHATEEIFQAVGTSRLGINDLDPPGQRNFVDDIYVPYLYSYWTNDLQDEISCPEILAAETETTSTIMESSTVETEKFETNVISSSFMPSTTSLPIPSTSISSSSSSTASKRRRQKSMSDNLENV